MTTQTLGDDQVAALAAVLSGDFGAYERFSLPLGRDPAWEAFPVLVAAAFAAAVRQRFRTAADPALPDFTLRMHAAYGLDPQLVSWLLDAALGAPVHLAGPLSEEEQIHAAHAQVALLYALVDEAGLTGARLSSFLAAARETAARTETDRTATDRTVAARPEAASAAAVPAPGSFGPDSALYWSTRRSAGRGRTARWSRRKIVTIVATVLIVVLGTGPATAFGKWLVNRTHHLPAAPAGLVAVLSAGPDEFVGLAGDQVREIGKAAGAFAGPHFAWQFGLVAVTDSTEAMAGYDGRDYSAAPGHQFIAIYAEQGPEPPFRLDTGDQVTAKVVVDGVARPVPADALTYSDGLLVSVPTGRTATLRVTDDGRTQSYDLRAGKRGPDAIGGYYQPQVVSGLDGMGDLDMSARCPDVPFLGTGLPCRVDMDLQFTGSGGSVQPWLPGLGWARPGHAWLTITDVSYSVQPVVTIAPGGGAFFLQDSKTFVLHLPGGQRIAAMPHTEKFDVAQDLVLVFDVPASFTSGTLVIRPAGRLVVADGPDHFTGRLPVKRIMLTRPLSPAGQQP